MYSARAWDRTRHGTLTLLWLLLLVVVNDINSVCVRSQGLYLVGLSYTFQRFAVFYNDQSAFRRSQNSEKYLREILGLCAGKRRSNYGCELA